MICLDLLQCYYRRSVRRVWGQCLRLSVVSLIADHLRENRKLKESLLETFHSIKRMLSFKKQYSVKQIKISVCSLALLAGLLLLSGCSTFSSSRYSAPYGQEWNSSPSPPPKREKTSHSSGDWLFFPSRRQSQQPSRRDTFLWSQLPLWEL